jgi:hypothetical protein
MKKFKVGLANSNFLSGQEEMEMSKMCQVDCGQVCLLSKKSYTDSEFLRHTRSG